LEERGGEDVQEDGHQTRAHADDEDGEPQLHADVLQKPLHAVAPPQQARDRVVEVLQLLGQPLVALVDVVAEIRDVIVVHLVCS
jgi:hypothetical protein